MKNITQRRPRRPHAKDAKDAKDAKKKFFFALLASFAFFA